MKIYVASPLFTPKEKKLINEISEILQAAGHETYLPMEHGVPDAWSYSNEVWGKKMFELDRDAINFCDALVCVYNGMDSDTGTSWEVGYAYAKNKPVVIFHNYDTDKEIGSLMICNGASHNVTDPYYIPFALLSDKTMNIGLPYQS